MPEEEVERNKSIAPEIETTIEANQPLDIYKALKGEYGKVVDQKNGMYYVHGNRYEMWVPKDIDYESADVVVWYPGTGGSSNDANALRKYVNSNNPPEYIVVAATYSGNTGTTRGNIFDKSLGALDNCNINVNNVLGIGFSDSGNTVLKQANDYIEKNDDMASHLSLLEVEGAWVDPKRCSEDKISSLVENNVPINFIIGKTGSDWTDTIGSSISYLAAIGANISKITTSQKHHTETNADVWKSHLPDLMLGLTNGLKTNPNYKVFGFNGGNWSEVGLSTLASLYKPVGEEVELLDDINLGVENLETIGSDVLISNFDYVINILKKLKDLMSKSEASGRQPGRFADIRGIPGMVDTYLNTYYDIVANLIKSLSTEVDAVESIAQTIKDMDKDLLDYAQDLIEEPIYHREKGKNDNINNHRFKEQPYEGNRNIKLKQKQIEFPEYRQWDFKNKNVRERIVDLTADDLNMLFNKWADAAEAEAKRKGIDNFTSSLRGKGEYFIEAADKYNIDPLVLVGITGIETGKGGYDARNYMKYNNFFGMDYLDVDGDGKSNVFRNDCIKDGNAWFDTPGEMIDACVERISDFYVDEHGAKTVKGIEEAGYAGNTPGYADMLSSIMKEAYDYIAENNK